MRIVGYVLIALFLALTIYGLVDIGPREGWFLIPFLILGLVAAPLYVYEGRRKRR